MRTVDGGGRDRALPRLLLALLPVALLATGCRPGDEAAGDPADEPAAAAAAHDTAEARDSGGRTTDGTAMPHTVNDSLRLRLETPARVTAGEGVPMALHVENRTNRQLTLYLVGRDIVFDLVVEREGGEVVWRRLEGEIIQSILRLEPLASGEALVLEDTWDQQSNEGEPVGPGRYLVRGELLTEGEPLVSPPESLEIVPR